MGEDWQLFNSNLSTDKWIGLYDRLGTTEFQDSARARWPDVRISHGDSNLVPGVQSRGLTIKVPDGPDRGAVFFLHVKLDDSAQVSVAGSDLPHKADVIAWFRNLLGPEHAVTFYFDSVFRFCEVPYGLDVEGMLALMEEASADE